jgi:hypothetical protein
VLPVLLSDTAWWHSWELSLSGGRGGRSRLSKGEGWPPKFAARGRDKRFRRRERRVTAANFTGRAGAVGTASGSHSRRRRVMSACLQVRVCAAEWSNHDAKFIASYDLKEARSDPHERFLTNAIECGWSPGSLDPDDILFGGFICRSNANGRSTQPSIQPSTPTRKRDLLAARPHLRRLKLLRSGSRE